MIFWWQSLSGPPPPPQVLPPWALLATFSLCQTLGHDDLRQGHLPSGFHLSVLSNVVSFLKPPLFSYLIFCPSHHLIIFFFIFTTVSTLCCSVIIHMFSLVPDGVCPATTLRTFRLRWPSALLGVHVAGWWRTVTFLSESLPDISWGSEVPPVGGSHSMTSSCLYSCGGYSLVWGPVFEAANLPGKSTPKTSLLSLTSWYLFLTLLKFSFSLTSQLPVLGKDVYSILT